MLLVDQVCLCEQFSLDPTSLDHLIDCLTSDTRFVSEFLGSYAFACIDHKGLYHVGCQVATKCFSSECQLFELDLVTIW